MSHSSRVKYKSRADFTKALFCCNWLQQGSKLLSAIEKVSVQVPEQDIQLVMTNQEGTLRWAKAFESEQIRWGLAPHEAETIPASVRPSFHEIHSPPTRIARSREISLSGSPDAVYLMTECGKQ